MPLSPVSVLPGGALPPESGRTVSAYDFRRPTKLSRENVRVLQMAYETFARRLTTVLTSGLRQVCRVEVTDITQQTYDDYVSNLAPLTLMVPLEIDAFGAGALEMSLPVALAAFDHMLGGPGGTQPLRALTDIENTILNGLIEQIIGVLAYALEAVAAVTIEAGQVEYAPQFLQIASASDPVVIGSFKLTVGAETADLTLCLPLARLLPRLTVKQRENAPAGITAAHPQLRERLTEVPVDLQVRFAPTPIDSMAVLNLAVGDIVPLNHKVGAPLDVTVGTTNVANAVAGRAGNQLAALVVERSTAALNAATIAKEIR